MVVSHCVSETAFSILFEHDDLKKRVSDDPVHTEFETDVADVAILRVPVGTVSRVEGMS